MDTLNEIVEVKPPYCGRFLGASSIPVDVYGQSWR